MRLAMLVSTLVLAPGIALAQGYSEASKGSQAVKVLQDAQLRFPDEALVTFELAF